MERGRREKGVSVNALEVKSCLEGRHGKDQWFSFYHKLLAFSN